MRTRSLTDSLTNSLTNSLRVSFWLSAISFLLTVFSVTLGGFVEHLDYLILFSLLALVILGLSAGALIVGIGGLLQSRGRGRWLWIATLLPAAWMWTLLAWG